MVFIRHPFSKHVTYTAALLKLEVEIAVVYLGLTFYGNTYNAECGWMMMAKFLL